MRRKKFDGVQPLANRLVFLEAYPTAVKLINITNLVRACRNPADDKFLSLALCGSADLLITGDADLLALVRHEEVKILSPREFLESELHS